MPFPDKKGPLNNEQTLRGFRLNILAGQLNEVVTGFHINDKGT